MLTKERIVKLWKIHETSRAAKARPGVKHDARTTHGIVDYSARSYVKEIHL